MICIYIYNIHYIHIYIYIYIHIYVGVHDDVVLRDVGLHGGSWRLGDTVNPRKKQYQCFLEFGGHGKPKEKTTHILPIYFWWLNAT